MDPNKINLTDLNKQPKKKPSLPKLSSLSRSFKKTSAGPGRDQIGRFAPSSASGVSRLWSKKGSTTMKKQKNFNWSRALPLVALVSLTGGFLVWRSLAATKPPAYQYSTYTCKSITKKPPATIPANDKTCIDYSSEAAVYRTYQAIFKYAPSEAAYKQWTQDMAGGDNAIPGRLKPQDLARRLLGTSAAKQNNGVLKGNPNDRKFIENLYKNIFGSTKDKKGIDYWQFTMAKNKWSRPYLIQQLIINKDIITKYSTPFRTDLAATPKSKVPKITIDPIARRKQEQRTKDAQAINKATKSITDKLPALSTDGKKRMDEASKIAARSGKDISKANLDVIKTNYLNTLTSRVNGFKGKSYKGAVDNNYTKVKALYEQSIEVTRYSPDITNYGPKKEFDIANSARSTMNRNIDNASWHKSEIQKALSTATKKYDKYQKYLKDKAACEAKTNHDWQGGEDGYCKDNTPVPTGGGGGSGGEVYDEGGLDSGERGSKFHKPIGTPRCDSEKYKHPALRGYYYTCYQYPNNWSTPGYSYPLKGLRCNADYRLKANYRGTNNWIGLVCLHNDYSDVYDATPSE